MIFDGGGARTAALDPTTDGLFLGDLSKVQVVDFVGGLVTGDDLFDGSQGVAVGSQPFEVVAACHLV